jgi:Periplasmic binding protein
MAVAATLLPAMGSAPAGAASSTPGVTAKTIAVGIPYVDIAYVDKTFGLKLNQGSYPDAYNALFKELNAHGGINGRKVVPFYVAVNPTGTASAASSCTQLVEDDHVFVAFAPLSGICYLEHGTLTINGTVTATVPGHAAANFTLTPPASAYDPLQIAVLAKQGVFKNKKVGVFGGFTTDEDEMKIVESALAKNHVHVVQTGVNSAPATDQVASFQQVGTIAQRFQNAGVNLVVAVGQGSAAWPDAEQTNQSTFNPPWVGTSYNDLAGYTIGKTSDASYVKNSLTTTPGQSASTSWRDPLIQKCVHTIKKAYPGDAIASPIGQPASDTSDSTYVSAMNACQDVAIFATIAKAAGKNLTVSSFTRAGEGLHGVVFPGVGSAVSFNGKPYAIGTVHLARYSSDTGGFVIAAHSSSP